MHLVGTLDHLFAWITQNPQTILPQSATRPKPVPNYKGTAAYEARQAASQNTSVDTEDLDAATALVAFKGSYTSQAKKAPAHCVPSGNTIQLPPLKSTRKIILDPMDKIFAQAMGMSQEEMVAQTEWEQEHALDDPTDSDAEEVVRPAKKDPKKGKKKENITVREGGESEEPPVNVDGSEDDESDSGVYRYLPLLLTFNLYVHSLDSDERSAWERLISSVKKFDIAFEVPYQTSQRNLTGITSHTTFSAFLEALAVRMETRLSLLSRISYTASYKPKKANADVMLEGEADWIKLIQDAEAYQTNARNKDKVWSIRIHDKSMTDAKESGTKVWFEFFSGDYVLTVYLRRKRPAVQVKQKRNPQSLQPRMPLYMWPSRRNTTVMLVRLLAMFSTLVIITNMTMPT